MGWAGPAAMLVGAWTLWRIAPERAWDEDLATGPAAGPYARQALRAVGLGFGGLVLVGLRLRLAAEGLPPWLVGLPPL